MHAIVSFIQLATQVRWIIRHRHRVGGQDAGDRLTAALSGRVGKLIDRRPNKRGDRDASLLGISRQFTVSLLVKQNLKAML
jgi:hypothetical protein